MHIVYILKSDRNNKRYIGYSSKTIEARLHDHNTGSNKWTRENGPFHVLLVEDYLTKQDAMKRERFLKSGQGRRWLDDNGYK